MEKTIEYSFLLEGAVVHVMDMTYRCFEQALPAHTHGENAYEFHYVVEGRGNVILKGVSYEAVPGILYVTGPGIKHEQIPEKGHFFTEFGIYLQVSHSGAPEGAVLHLLMDTPCFFGRGTAELSAIVSALMREQKERQIGFEEKITHLLAEFLIACVRNYETEPLPAVCRKAQSTGNPRPFVGHAGSQLVMDEIFLYEYRDITLDALAHRLGFSVRQTQRWIRKVYGKSFQEKKLEARMSAAAMLLVNSDEKITNISDRLGYSSIEHFSSAFSHYFGMTPRRYRKQNAE